MSLRDKYTDEEWDDLEKKSKSFFEAMKKPKDEYIRIAIVTDDSGHDYVIPFELKSEFTRLIDLGEVAEDDFNDKFEKYMCGGDPSSMYEFYIKLLPE